MAKQELSSLARRYLYYRAENGELANSTRKYLRSIKLLPRVMTKLSDIDSTIELFEHKFSIPVLLAPMAFHCLFNQEGEVASAGACAQEGIGFCYNYCYSSRSIDSLKKHVPDGGKFLHIYPWRERENFLAPIIRQAEESHLFSAILFTADHPHDRVQQFITPYFCQGAHKYKHPEEICTLPNLCLLGGKEGTCDRSLGWDFVDWLRQQTNLPIIIKGILSPKDAEIAVDHGVNGIVVSNHGGRQLDCTVPSLMVLPKIAKIVSGKNIKLFVDSGIEYSTDIFKAIALGADAVLIGRPMLKALVQGQTGLSQYIARLKYDFQCDMASMGCSSLKMIGQHCLYQVNSPELVKFSDQMPEQSVFRNKFIIK